MSEQISESAPETSEIVSTRIPVKRDVILHRPGNINVASNNGAYPGCRIVEFSSVGQAVGLEHEDAERFETQRKEYFEGGNGNQIGAVEAMNLYFKNRANLLTVQVVPDASGALFVLYTNQLDADEMEEWTHMQELLSAGMAKFREEKAAAEAKANEEHDKREAEVFELVELGKKEKAGGFVKRARDAEAKLEELSKENLRLRRQLEDGVKTGTKKGKK